MKQLVPNSLDEYIAEHKPGDTVSGRIVEVSGQNSRVELGEGIQATCRVSSSGGPKQEASGDAPADLSALTSMLSARWKSGSVRPEGKPESVSAGQIRSFRITKLDAAPKKIELELA